MSIASIFGAAASSLSLQSAAQQAAAANAAQAAALSIGGQAGQITIGPIGNGVTLSLPSGNGGNVPPNWGGGMGSTAWGGGFVSGVSGAIPNYPPQRDRFEYACEVAAMQPEDTKWRRFQHALFRIEDFICASSEGSGSIVIQLRLEGATRQEVFTLPFDCTDPVQWFAEHVLKMNFPNAPHAT